MTKPETLAKILPLCPLTTAAVCRRQRFCARFGIMLNRRAFLASTAAMALAPRARAATLVEASRLLVEEGRYLPLLHQMQAEGTGIRRWAILLARFLR